MCGDGALPRAVRSSSRWWTKSNWISNMPPRYGIGEVVKPRVFTYSAVFHQWFSSGVRASRILPTICVHICSVRYVASHCSRGKAGQSCSTIFIEKGSLRTVLCFSDPILPSDYAPAQFYCPPRCLPRLRTLHTTFRQLRGSIVCRSHLSLEEI